MSATLCFTIAAYLQICTVVLASTQGVTHSISAYRQDYTESPCDDQPHSHWQNGTCVCNPKYYYDDLTDTCLPCSMCCAGLNEPIQQCTDQGLKNKCNHVKHCPGIGYQVEYWALRVAIPVVAFVAIGTGTFCLCSRNRRVRQWRQDNCCKDRRPIAEVQAILPDA